VSDDDKDEGNWASPAELAREMARPDGWVELRMTPTRSCRQDMFGAPKEPEWECTTDERGKA
jgi:hypothetical protein